MSQWTAWIKPCSVRDAIVFTLKASAVSLALAIGLIYAGNRYRIAVDTLATQCLPGTRVYLIDTYVRDLHRGDIAVFAARGLAAAIARGHESTRSLAAHYQDGTRIIKVVAGMPGDQIAVTEEQTTVNGRQIGEGLDLAASLALPVETFTRTEAVPQGAYCVMGETRNSFDSRYWGYVVQEQVIGRAYAIF